MRLFLSHYRQSAAGGTPFSRKYIIIREQIPIINIRAPARYGCPKVRCMLSDAAGILRPAKKPSPLIFEGRRFFARATCPDFSECLFLDTSYRTAGVLLLCITCGAGIVEEVAVLGSQHQLGSAAVRRRCIGSIGVSHHIVGRPAAAD